MNNSINTQSRTSRTKRRNKKSKTAGQQVIPALLATGACGLAAGPANALQLGEIEVQSALGQPLRASIAYALRPGEQLVDSCILLKPAMGFPAMDRAVVSVDASRIHIRGVAPLKEPIAAIGLSVNCAYTANLTREYLLMLDPVPLQPASANEVRFAQAEQSPAAPAPTVAARTQRPAPKNRVPVQPDISQATTYRVQPGDSLSGIASRIENRPVGLWPAVEQIFAANPEAFIDGDINKLKAGSSLLIPSFGADSALSIAASSPQNGALGTSAEAVVAPETEFVQPTLETPESRIGETEAATTVPSEMPDAIDQSISGASDADALKDDTGELTTAATRDAEPVLANSEPAGNETEAVDTTANLIPGDIIITNDDATSAIEPAGAGSAEGSSGSTTSWAVMLGGAGVLIGAALFLYGRRSRWIPTPPAEPAESEAEIPDDAPTTRNRVLAKVDFDVSQLAEGSATSLLDADLDEGTGLTPALTAASVDGEDFAEAAARTIEEDAPPIIVSNGPVEPQTILENEVLPTDDDEYDVSMIMDATLHKFSDSDVTAKELKAVAIEESASDDEDDYTLSNALDYDILEQDYEEGLSATQMLDNEIMAAAEELKSRLDGSDDIDDSQSIPALSESEVDIEATFSDDLTASMQSTALIDAGVRVEDSTNVMLTDESALTGEQTAMLPAEDLVEADDDETAVVAAEDLDEEIEELGSDKTAEIPHAQIERMNIEDTSATTELTAEVTAELPSAVNDDTAEISVESGEYRTRKSASQE